MPYINSYSYAGDLFRALTYAGNGGVGDITLNTLFRSSMTILKNRTNTDSWYLIDSNRSAGQYLKTDTAGAEAGPIDNFAFNDATVTFGNGASNQGWNASANNYLALNWKKAPGFFDILEYTGTGSAQTLPHTLATAPAMIWFKSKAAKGWMVYHSALDENTYLVLDTDAVATVDANFLGGVAPSAADITVGNLANNNTNGETIEAYLFGALAGKSAAGSYTGTSGTTTVNLGWQPSVVIIKNTINTGNGWFIYVDGVGGFDLSTGAESTGPSGTFSITATGFTMNSSSGLVNMNGSNYIYYAVK